MMNNEATMIKAGELWLLLAGLCLAVSGVLSLPIFLGKIPALTAVLPSLEWTHWSLVVHVILALLLWHLAVPVGINFFVSERTAEDLGIFSAGLCALGTIMLFFAVPSDSSRPLLTNYIPVMTNLWFAFGLACCLTGILLGFFGARGFLDRRSRQSHLYFLPLGKCFYLAALLALGLSVGNQYCNFIEGNFHQMEYVMWGAGHILQHLSSLYLVVAWNMLLASGAQKRFVFGKELLPTYAYLGLGLVPVVYLLQLPIASLEYRQGFTMLMRWGIFPAFILFFIQLGRHRDQVHWRQIERYKLIAFAFSALLLTLGFVFGALIDGQNLKIPGHYHATIGAVTIAFMAVTLDLLRKFWNGPRLRPIVLFCSYGIGQILFSSGLFIAGVFQVSRKTYGDQLELASLGTKVGLGIVGLGGLFALVGGALFVTLYARVLRRYAQLFR